MFNQDFGKSISMIVRGVAVVLNPKAMAALVAIIEKLPVHNIT
jgi:hypothetical protein